MGTRAHGTDGFSSACFARDAGQLAFVILRCCPHRGRAYEGSGPSAPDNRPSRTPDMRAALRMTSMNRSFSGGLAT